MNLAAGYCRVSTSGQTGPDHVSLEVQRKDIASYAAQYGLTIVRWFTDVESAYRRAVVREELEAVFEAAEAGEFRHLIIWKSDRFGRRAGQSLVNLDELDQLGVDAHSVKDNIRDFMARGVNLLVAEQSSRDTSVRAKAGHEQRVRQGFFPSGQLPPGLRRKGYRGQPDWLDIVTDEDTWPIVFDLFEQRQAGLTIKDLTVYAHARGLPLHTSSVADMLRNPLYAGLIPWGGKLHPGRHPAFVPLDWIETRRPRGRNPRHWLGGLGYCLGCGVRGTIAFNGRASFHFRCQHLAKGGLRSQCPGATVNMARDVEPWLIPQLKQFTIEPGTLERLETEAKAGYSVAFDRWDRTSGNVARDAARLESRMSRLMDLHLDDKIDEGLFLAKQRELLQQKRALDALREAPPVLPDFSALERARDALASLPDLWESGNDAVKRTIARAVVRKLWLHGQMRSHWRVEWVWDG